MLLISEDLDEILALADRIAVMYEGAIVGELDAPTRDRRGDRPADGREGTIPVRIERRLEQPRWLLVAVPVGSLVFAFLAVGHRAAGDGHDALSSYRKIIDAAFLSNGALGQTLIAATPLAFTGLAAAAAFRMRLFNIGGEGQLYIGAISAAAAGLYLGGSGGASPFVIAAMVVAGGAGGAPGR